MPISNVALTNTFDEWRTRTNQLIVSMNDVLGDGLATYRSVTSNVVTANSISLSGVNVGSTLVSAFDRANLANGTANTSLVIASGAFDKANSANVIASGAFDKANSANVIASGAFDKANSANVIASGAFDKANSANVIASGAFDKANSANVIASGAFDKANSANVIASAAFNRANLANGTANTAFAIAPAAFDKANSANVIASAAFDKANGSVQLGWTTLVANGTTITPSSNIDTLTIRTTGNISIVGVSANDNIIFDLTTTGVTAGSYGNATSIPAITIDSRGRVVSASNTSISNFYTGSSSVNTDFPIGSYLVVDCAGSYARNAQIPVYLAFGSIIYQDTDAGVGSVSGTWRSRGYWADTDGGLVSGYYLVQRVS
jgi:peroxiredoxin family protein